MAKGKGGSIMECFGRLEDPRIDRCKRHQLLDIITIAICAVICGADSWVHVEMFAKVKEGWFRTFLDLPQGIPSHDTFGDVFSRLDPDLFQECFMEWSRPAAWRGGGHRRQDGSPFPRQTGGQRGPGQMPGPHTRRGTRLLFARSGVPHRAGFAIVRATGC